jgi:Flp pilus assembly pilin Flp
MTMTRTRLIRDQRGAVAVEFAVIGALLLFVLLTIIKFGLDFFWIKSLEKAAQFGGRMAVVSTPAAAGLPERNGLTEGALYGYPCRDDSNPCIGFDPAECQGDGCVAAPFNVIFNRMDGIAPFLEPANVTLRYEYAGLGFAGGPIVPVVTVTISGVANPLGPMNLYALLGGGGAGQFNTLPDFRATLTGEDLSSAAVP